VSGVAVTTAAESAEHDARAIAGGIPSRALMRAAGMLAAGEIIRRYPVRVARGVSIFAGPGNNGGDAWVVAGALARAGVSVRVTEVMPPRTPDAEAERAATVGLVSVGRPLGYERLIVDGLLGTGSTGAPRSPISEAIDSIAARRAAGALVVALDVPSGVNATTGEAEHAVVADVTLTFGTIKQGLLVARARTGRLALLDIGLPPLSFGPMLVDAAWAGARTPAIAADANKGTRRRLAIVAGGPSMIGAAILASRAAHRSGVGLVRLFVAPENVAIAQSTEPESLAFPWPVDDATVDREISSFAHAVLIGPGLGTTGTARAILTRVLARWHGPTVVDADALNLFAGQVPALSKALAGRPALLTPHPGELSRLVGGGRTIDQVLADRFAAGATLARDLGAGTTVLLKGVPTVVSSASGDRVVSAAGTPALATGGSGDLLAGIAGTLLAQTEDPFASAGIAAWIHGTAAEIASAGRSTREVTLDDVTASLGAAWQRAVARPPFSYPVLAELPPVGDAARV
jgi:ADP-dependent NAD(P)H-hydrate dehydratase / NAD(P)H-hydrate epimerase